MKRVVAALNPQLDGFEASCFDGHYITGDVSDDDFAAIEAQRRLQFDEEEAGDRSPPGAAKRGGEGMTATRRLPRVNLPADARLDTLAVREGLPPSRNGARTPRRCS